MTEQERKRHVWPMVAAAFVLLLVLYVLSCGPAMWLLWNHDENAYPWIGTVLGQYPWIEATITVVYHPLQWVEDCGPEWSREWLYWYGSLWR